MKMKMKIKRSTATDNRCDFEVFWYRKPILNLQVVFFFCVVFQV